jgi:hypothetical protein
MPGRAKLSTILAACALVVGGVIAALVLTTGGDEKTAVRTTGSFAPITVVRPQLPQIGGGIPVDVDPLTVRSDFNTTLAPLPGAHRYRLTISNTSNLGAVNAFQWYPPVGVHIVRVAGSSAGRCSAAGLSGFSGNQFPTVVLYPNILCEQLDLKPPSCTCRGDGGSVSISFVTDMDIGGSLGDVKVRAATLVFHRIPAA